MSYREIISEALSCIYILQDGFVMFKRHLNVKALNVLWFHLRYMLESLATVITTKVVEIK
jgi:hypothetical protein